MPCLSTPLCQRTKAWPKLVNVHYFLIKRRASTFHCYFLFLNSSHLGHVLSWQIWSKNDGRGAPVIFSLNKVALWVLPSTDKYHKQKPHWIMWAVVNLSPFFYGCQCSGLPHSAVHVLLRLLVRTLKMLGLEWHVFKTKALQDFSFRNGNHIFSPKKNYYLSLCCC